MKVDINLYKDQAAQQQTIQNLPNSNKVAANDNQPRLYNRPIGYEEKSYLCSWCETPTKFKDHKKLSKHIKRFHNAFDQKNRGVKRGDDDLDEIAPKRQRGDNKYNLYEFDDDDKKKDSDVNGENNENYNNNDNEERNEDDNDVGFDEPQMRFKHRKRLVMR